VLPFKLTSGERPKIKARLKVQNVIRKSYELETSKRKRNTDYKIKAQHIEWETPKRNIAECK
jgi:hypothetical protein